MLTKEAKEAIKEVKNCAKALEVAKAKLGLIQAECNHDLRIGLGMYLDCRYCGKFMR